MRATPVELFENLRGGLLWVGRDGTAKYVNHDAAARTGWQAGQRLSNPELVRAVLATFAGRGPVAVDIANPARPDDAAAPKLSCQVVAGLGDEDVVVLVAPAVDAEADSAFNSLMQVLRADLHEPLLTAHRALRQVRESVPGLAMDPVLGRVDDVVGVLDKLLELAQLWGSGQLFQDDRIELWPLLQQVWAEVEPIAVERKVTVCFNARDDAEQLATVYGSAHWLSRVFSECFESALRGVPPGGTLEIEHRQMGPRALIVFRNGGVFSARFGVALPVTAPPAPPPRRGAPPPPAPAGDPAKARDHISFKLCSHIVKLHGGQLREEDDDGERHFLIDLPTGAPHRSDDAPIDIAQAQHYARDLSALMARSRRPARPGTR